MSAAGDPLERLAQIDFELFRSHGEAAPVALGACGIGL